MSHLCLPTRFNTVLRAAVSFRGCSRFKSVQNVETLYPLSDHNSVFKKPPNIALTDNNEIGPIPIDSLQISYSYSGGPGGQHVNRTEAKSKVEVRFQVLNASWIPENIKARFMEKESHRITKDNYFIISSDRTRKQLLNQADCIERIRRSLRECTMELNRPPPSEETVEFIQKRKIAANENRLREKKSNSWTKQMRRKPNIHDL